VKTLIIALLLFAGVAAGAPLRVVVLGDSVGHGAGDESGRGIAGNLDCELDARGIAHAPAVNAAVNGSRTWNVFAQMRNAAVSSADVIVLSIGGNDLYGDRWSQLLSTVAPSLMMTIVRARVAVLVRTLQSVNHHARIVLIGLYNPYRELPLDRAVARWNGGLLERFAGERGVTVLPIAELFAATDRRSTLDHFHPNAAAYAAIARRVGEGL
jgi:lysophospholipase L1-like esterase